MMHTTGRSTTELLKDDIAIHSIFPSPIYVTERNFVVEEEKKVIEDIIKEGVYQDSAHGLARFDSGFNQDSNNTYILDTKLKNLKEFCEKHIKIYVEEIINPKEELDFYITESWLNVIEPGGTIRSHWHQNSIISGTYYVSIEEGDNITFYEEENKIKEAIKFESKESNVWNSGNCVFPANNNELFLFPSWLVHEVLPNETATKDRISISFNTFAKGNLGTASGLNELVLK